MTCTNLHPGGDERTLPDGHGSLGGMASIVGVGGCQTKAPKDDPVDADDVAARMVGKDSGYRLRGLAGRCA